LAVGLGRKSALVGFAQDPPPFSECSRHLTPHHGTVFGPRRGTVRTPHLIRIKDRSHIRCALLRRSLLCALLRCARKTQETFYQATRSGACERPMCSLVIDLHAKHGLPRCLIRYCSDAKCMWMNYSVRRLKTLIINRSN